MAKQNSKKGFTLVETLVAIAILVTGIVAPMTIAARGLQSAFHAREQLTATFLAQEGTELVRLRRDNMALSEIQISNKTPWITSTPSGALAPGAECYNTTGCGLDGLSAQVDCGTTGACRLHLDTTMAEKVLYAHNKIGGSWKQSPFTRSIQVSQVNTDQAKVIVTVEWHSGLFGAKKSVVLTSILADRYKGYVLP